MQITRRKLCFYYTCKFGIISITYVINSITYILGHMITYMYETIYDYDFFVVSVLFILYNYSFCIRSIPGYINQTEVQRLRTQSKIDIFLLVDINHVSTSHKSYNCYINSEHRKMRAKQQHMCKEMNQYTNDTNRKWFLLATEDVLQGRYKSCIDLTQKLQLLY